MEFRSNEEMVQRIKDAPLFVVYVGTHEYKVFTDGSISGFGDAPGTFIANYFTVHAEMYAQERQSMSSARTSPQSIETESLSG